MSVYGRILLAGLGSLALLLAAFGFQHIGELAPCPMCLWQRWPHAIAIVIAIIAVTAGWKIRRALAGMGAMIVGIGAAIGAFHAGVEQKWWDGPASCSGGFDPTGLSADQALEALMSAPVIACDEIVWDLFGVTMAGWNAIFSLGLAVLWLYAALPRMTTRFAEPGGSQSS